MLLAKAVFFAIDDPANDGLAAALVESNTTPRLMHGVATAI
jgi:hypothetical protein